VFDLAAVVREDATSTMSGRQPTLPEPFSTDDDRAEGEVFEGDGVRASSRSAAPLSTVPPPRGDEITLAAAVHEIQNVLASVLGWASLARERNDPELSARAMPIIERAVLRASEMVGTLADTDSLLRVRDTTFDVSLVLGEVRDLLDARCLAMGVSLRVLKPSHPSSTLLARGDPARVSQVLVNLVLNAASAVSKSRPAGLGLVELSSELFTAESRVALTVRDNGPGMDEATLAHLYDPFFTTAKPDHDGPRGTGRGLGMAVSRSLSETMGARLEVHSEPGHGTEATLHLRRAPRPSEPALVPPMATGDARLPLGLRVLVVDDEPAIRELLEVALTLRGARVTAVADVRAARKALRRGDADVALIDEGLGRAQSGAAFMAEMSVSWPDVGRVLMTGAASLDHVTEVPCAAFVRKPFLLDDVVRALCVASDGG
jgi:signal transduction histidine kinase